MGKFRKKPIVIEATQWFESGDHPEDDREVFHTEESGDFLGEGKVVRYYRVPDHDGQVVCKKCAVIMHDHGWIDTLEGGHIVCPGDWIITGVQGERYPCKPDIFEATYEYANEADDPNEDCGVTLQCKGIAGYELELELTVNGHVGTCHISHLFFESIKDFWEGETVKAHGMDFKECLLADLDNFNAGLKPGAPLLERYCQERFKVADTDGTKVRFQRASEPPNNVDFSGRFAPSPSYISRLHSLCAAMVDHLRNAHRGPFEDAWLSTFDEPDCFPEITKLVNKS